MTPKAPKEIEAVLTLDEGRFSVPYRDTKGFWTIGIGRFIGPRLEDLRINDQTIDMWFLEDVNEAVADVCAILGEDIYNKLEPARQAALISMAFTLGREKFSKFRNTLAAVKMGDWDAAANGVLNSKWARDVDPKNRIGIGRDDRVAYMLKTKKFPRDYNV